MKKGFTLIELLAVILILGIIALIAIPTVGNIINEAKEGAIRRSAEQYVKAVEEYAMLEQMKTGNIITSFTVGDHTLNIKGTMPTNGSLSLAGGEVTSCTLWYDDYEVTCDGNDLIINKGDSPILSSNPTLVIDNNANGEADPNDKFCIGTECFYVMSNTAGVVKALAEYNLNVGYDLTYNNNEVIDISLLCGGSSLISCRTYSSEVKGNIIDGITYTKLNPTVIKQDSTKNGTIKTSANEGTFKGLILISEYEEGGNSYWAPSMSLLSTYGSSYPAYVYDSNSSVYSYIEDYTSNLSSLSGSSITGSLISLEELTSLGCTISGYSGSCTNASSWVYNTSYNTGVAMAANMIYMITNEGVAGVTTSNTLIETGGLRPVITINASDIN